MIDHDAMIADLCTDPDVIEAARVDAWFSDGRKPDWFSTRPNVIPNGWPDGVDPEQHTRRHVERCLPKDDPQPDPPADAEPDGLVKQFRSSINAS